MAESPAAAGPIEEEDVPPPATKFLIMASLMTAMFMSTIDSTIANVALPHMQGSLSAGQDQITWVLTSYILAQLLGTPMVAWLADRIGRKTLMLIGVGGFTAASVACGMAMNLEQMVLFRMLQGLFCAPLMPITQAIMFDINTGEDRMKATAVFGMGVMAGPVLGPIVGGWITDAWNWRWCFLINLPFGIASFIGLWMSLPHRKKVEQRPFDIMGFGFLALFLASLQMILDRGPSQDWFGSNEIMLYAALSTIGLYLFIVHTMTAKKPFFDPIILRDRNFLIGVSIGFLFSALIFSSTALVPAFLQGVMHLPPYDAGLVTAPRGLGMVIAMGLTASVAGRISNSTLIAAGFIANAVVMYVFSTLTLDADTTPIAVWGFVVGFFTGFVFVSMTNITFSTVPAHLRTEAASVYTLIRSLGMAIGISGMQGLLVHNIQVNHSTLSEHASVDNAIFNGTPVWNLATEIGRAVFDGEISRQATMIAYMDDFRLSVFLSLAALPLLLLLRDKKEPPVQKSSANAREERVEMHYE